MVPGAASTQSVTDPVTFEMVVSIRIAAIRMARRSIAACTYSQLDSRSQCANGDRRCVESTSEFGEQTRHDRTLRWEVNSRQCLTDDVERVVVGKPGSPHDELHDEALFDAEPVGQIGVVDDHRAGPEFVSRHPLAVSDQPRRLGRVISIAGEPILRAAPGSMPRRIGMALECHVGNQGSLF